MKTRIATSKTKQPKERIRRQNRQKVRGLVSLRRVALHLSKETALNQDKVLGVLEYIRKRPNWEIPMFSNFPTLSLEELGRWEGDGVIGDFHSLEVVHQLQARGLVVVNMTFSLGPKAGVPTVVVDSEKIGKLAAEHLLARKFKRFAFLGFAKAGERPKEHFRQREAAFTESVRAQGLACSSHYAHFSRTVDELLGADPWRPIVAELNPPCAVMACADHAAFGILEACRELGLRVPEDVAVMGVDNSRVLCLLSKPRLTSIDPRGNLVGYQAAELMDHLLDGKSELPLYQVVAPGEIRLRDSTNILATSNMEVTAAIRFINTHAREYIDVSDVMRVVSISRRSLERHFREVTGMGIYESIRKAHVDIARRLLIESSHTIEEIARQSGFHSPQRLNEACLALLGMSAVEFRERNRK